MNLHPKTFLLNTLSSLVFLMGNINPEDILHLSGVLVSLTSSTYLIYKTHLEVQEMKRKRKSK